MTVEEIKEKLEELRILTQKEAQAQIFKFRKDILLNIEILLENRIIRDKDIIELMIYSN